MTLSRAFFGVARAPEEPMRDPELSFPEVLFIVGTRAALAAGVALLFSDKLSRGQRRSIGAALVAVGAVTTIPAAMALLSRQAEEGPSPAAA
jgi:hypothetical protein